MSIEINGKVYRNLQEQVEKNKDDIEEILDSGFVEYSAGDGIDIEEGVISVDDTVATKSDLNGYIKDNDTNYSSIFKGQYVEVQETSESGTVTTTYGPNTIVKTVSNKLVPYTYMLPQNMGTLALTSDIPSLTNYVTLDEDQTITGVKTFGTSIKVADSAFTAWYGAGGIGLEGPSATNYNFFNISGGAYFTYIKTASNDPSSTTVLNNRYNLPHQDETGTNTYTLATTADIPTYTGGSGISVSGTTISADSTLARVADIPSITGLTMYNYKITISGVDGGTSTARSGVYIVSLPYQWDYSQLTKYDIIRLVPIWSIVSDPASSGSKKVGVFHWQTGTIAQIDWVDGTYTFMDFTSGFDATVEAASPTHW